MPQQTFQPETFQPETQTILLQEPKSGLDLFDVALIFARRKWQLLGFTVVFAALFFFWSLRHSSHRCNGLILR